MVTYGNRTFRLTSEAKREYEDRHRAHVGRWAQQQDYFTERTGLRGAAFPNTDWELLKWLECNCLESTENKRVKVMNVGFGQVGFKCASESDCVFECPEGSIMGHKIVALDNDHDAHLPNEGSLVVLKKASESIMNLFVDGKQINLKALYERERKHFEENVKPDGVLDAVVLAFGDIEAAIDLASSAAIDESKRQKLVAFKELVTSLRDSAIEGHSKVFDEK